jgi:hypothetical protein
MMKLNGWQRIGVVISILWALGAGIYERKSTVEYSYQFYSNSLEYCRSAAKRAQEYEGLVSRDVLAASKAWENSYWDCNKQSLETADKIRGFNSNAVLSVLAVSLLPIVFGWLLALLSIKIFRWIRVGFGTNSVVPVANRSTIVDAVPPKELAVGGEVDNAKPAAPKNKTELPDARGHTPLWLALIAFALAVLLVANRLMAQGAGVSPLAFLSDLASVLPTLSRHPDAVMNYLAEATGTAVVIPLLHVGIASIFPRMRNKTSRRRIFIGWSVVGAIAATFL